MTHVRVRARTRTRTRTRVVVRGGGYFLTSHSVFYNRVGQIAMFSHGQP